MHRPCIFVLDLDAARLLAKRMYASETVAAFIASLKKKNLYIYRSKASYETLFETAVEELHRDVRKAFTGRLTRKEWVSPALGLFCAHVVKPCIDVEPGADLRQAALDKLLEYMRADVNTTPLEIVSVFELASGRTRRHPALHGAMMACADKCRRIESGKSTTRKAFRNCATFRQHFYIFFHLFWHKVFLVCGIMCGTCP